MIFQTEEFNYLKKSKLEAADCIWKCSVLEKNVNDDSILSGKTKYHFLWYSLAIGVGGYLVPWALMTWNRKQRNWEIYFQSMGGSE